MFKESKPTPGAAGERRGCVREALFYCVERWDGRYVWVTRRQTSRGLCIVSVTELPS